jgi:hypothetical protein
MQRRESTYSSFPQASRKQGRPTMLGEAERRERENRQNRLRGTSNGTDRQEALVALISSRFCSNSQATYASSGGSFPLRRY